MFSCANKIVTIKIFNEKLSEPVFETYACFEYRTRFYERWSKYDNDTRRFNQLQYVHVVTMFLNIMNFPSSILYVFSAHLYSTVRRLCFYLNTLALYTKRNCIERTTPTRVSVVDDHHFGPYRFRLRVKFAEERVI
jgi:hypothetical protein